MKKTMIVLAAASAVLLSSCGMKSAKLETQNDSLSYAMGYLMGQSYDEGLISKADDPDKASKTFFSALEEGYNNAPESPEDIEAQAKLIGKQFGESISLMAGQPIWNGAETKLNKDLAVQGVINALNKHTDNLDKAAAEELLQKAMQALMEQQMKAAAAAPAEPAAPAADTAVVVE